MGAQCGCGGPNGEETNELTTSKIPKNGVTLDNRHYSARDIWIIIKMQSWRRGFLARQRVQRMRYEMYNPGYVGGAEKEDYDNINVQ